MKTLQKIFLLQFLLFLNPVTSLQASDSDTDGKGEQYCDSDTFDGASVDTLSSNRKLKKYPLTKLHKAVRAANVQEVEEIVTADNFNPKKLKYYRGKTPLDRALYGYKHKDLGPETRKRFKQIKNILIDHNVTHTNEYK